MVSGEWRKILECGQRVARKWLAVPETSTLLDMWVQWILPNGWISLEYRSKSKSYKNINRFYQGPGQQKKHLLVQIRVECTAFSDQNYLFIEYIPNFFHMNDSFLLLYQVLDKLSYLNLQFNYTTRLHRANFLSFSGEKGDRKCFL